LLESRESISQIGSQLELLTLDSATQPLAKLVDSAGVRHVNARRRLVTPTHVS
jgi:hypothetical protein